MPSSQKQKDLKISSMIKIKAYSLQTTNETMGNYRNIGPTYFVVG